MAKKRATGDFRAKKRIATINHTLFTATAHSHHPHHRRPPPTSCILLPLSTTVRRCPLPPAAIRCRPLPSPAAFSHVRLCQPLILLSSAHNVSAPIFRYLSPPLQSKFVAANDSVSFLILLRPDNDNEEETRSPSSPVAPDAHRIIGRSAADDSMPFYYIATR